MRHLKCTLCTYGSWLVGVSTLALVAAGLFDLQLPTGTVASIIYVLLAVNALGFLYYQIVPCLRCAARK